MAEHDLNCRCTTIIVINGIASDFQYDNETGMNISSPERGKIITTFKKVQRGGRDMKISSVISFKDTILLKKHFPHINLEKDFTDDEWDTFIDDVQDKAAEVLQANDKSAIEFDTLAAKLSELEY